MRTSQLPAHAVAILTLVACSPERRDSTSSHETGSAAADSAARYTTHAMSEGLTKDVQRSDVELAALEDSIYRLLGDTVTAVVKEADVRWAEYRKLECDALRLAFSGGTMAPVAQLECWIALTDARRRFLGEQYEFIRPPPRAAPAAGAR